MSEDEKVAETFRRLKYPPLSQEEELLAILSEEIAAEIDKEILSNLRDLK